MLNNSDSDKEFDNYLDSLYVLSHSQNTVHTYLCELKKFRKFIKEMYHLDVLEFVEQTKNNHIDVYDALRKFVIYLDKEGKKPATISTLMAAAKGYLRHEGVKIYSEDFKQVVKLPKKIRYREEPLSKEILVRLLHNAPSKLQVAILVSIASGMRIGELAQIKISDIDFSSNPTRILLRAEITKGRQARETYLTREATTALKDYLSRYFGWRKDENNANLQDKVIFSRTSKFNSDCKTSPARLVISSLEVSLVKHTSMVPELSKTNENGRYVIHFHAFRKYFRTEVGNAVGRDYAEALIGHHFYMDTYYNLTEEKRRELYLKAEPHLTISDYAKIERDLLSVTERQKEIEESHLELIRLMKQDHVTFPKALEKYIK